MRSASIRLLCKTRIIGHRDSLYPVRRKTFVDLVLEEARRRGRGHELAMDLGRNSAVLDQPAVAELDLQNLRLGVVAGRADLARVDAYAFHVALLSHSSSCGLPMLDHQLQVLQHLELVAEHRLRKTLSPDLMIE